MKISTQLIKIKLVILIIVFLSSFSVFSQSTPTFGGAQGPTLISGTANQQGARYLFENVVVNVNGMTSNADALLTIINTTDITINNVDSTLGEDNRFEPSITTTADNGFVEWEILFIEQGTASATEDGAPLLIDSYTLEAIDVDGNEFFEVLVPDSYTVEEGNGPGTAGCPQGSAATDNVIGCPSELVITNNGSFTRFTSGADFSAGINTTRTEYVVSVVYNNVSRVRFRNGRTITGGLRQNSISFLGEVIFQNPNTVVVNSPPIVINNLGNSVIINSTNNTPINVLSGSSDPDDPDVNKNIDPETIILIDPNNPSNTGSVGNDLTIVGVGTYSVDNLGNVVFTPANNYVGIADVNFRVEDKAAASSNIGVLEIRVVPDSDNDGVSDTDDIDDDNDGVLDTVESGGIDPSADADNDGTPNYQDAQFCTSLNGFGICNELDPDNDGVPNHLDLDADGDGIPDNNEAQTTLGYIVAQDTNSDGIPDVTANGLPVSYNFNSDELGLTPINTDNLQGPDYLDTDSDEDGLSDTAESGLPTSTLDSDGDGLNDAVDETDAQIGGLADYSDNNGIANSTEAFPDVDGDLNEGGNVDFRDNTNGIDNDNDSVNNAFDDDDDNDGITDIQEGFQFFPGTIANPGSCTGSEYTFSNAIYITGTGGGAGNVNSQYRFTNVATGLDAIVTITAKDVGVTLVNINNTTFGVSQAFQPRMRYAANANGDRKITFNVRFVDSGTTNSAIVPSVGGFFQDVDGQSFEREFYRVNDIVGYSLSNPTNILAGPISDPALGTEVIQFIANGSGSIVVGPDPINLANTNRVFFQKQDINQLNFTIGIEKNINQVIDRYYSLLFDECELGTFPNPTSVFVPTNTPDTDGDNIPDYLDTDSDGDGCNDADEAYANTNADVDNNGTYGTGTLTAADVDANGLVTAAGVTGNNYNTSPATLGSSFTYLQGVIIQIDNVPTDQNGVVGGTAEFKATASGSIVPTTPLTTASTNLNFQWQLSTDSGTTFNNISGASGVTTSGTEISYTTPTLVITDDGNIYNVVFTNEANICFEEASAALTITNSPPVAVNDNYTVNEDVSIVLTPLNLDSDPDLDTLTIESINGVVLTPGVTQSIPINNGTVIITDPNSTPGDSSDDVITFTPDANYNGSVTIPYVINDGNGETATANEIITVNPITDPISDLDETVSTDEDTPVSGDLLANLTDVDSMDHTITGASVDTDGDGNPDTLVLGTATLIIDNSGNPIGDITVNTDGTYTFTPAPNYNGSVPVITYGIVDDNDATDTDTSTIAITVNPITDPISDLDETVSTDEDTPVSGDLLANLTDVDSMDHTITGASVDTDGDGNPDTLVLGTATLITDNSGNAIGDITVNADGTYTFTPAPNYNGSVPVITYGIVDDNDATDTDTSTIAITVNPITDPISDLDETVSTDEESVLSGDLLANLTDADSMDHTITGASVDTDGDGNPDTLVLGTATLITDNSGNAIGDITVNADGTYTFTPAPNYNGSVPVITYGIVDDNDATDTDTSTIAITVNPITDPISDLDETVSTDEDTPVSGDLLTNLTDVDSMDHTITGASVDTDGDGNPDTLVLGTATLITDNSGNAIGDITVNADGTYTFTPAPNYNGSVPVITYGIVDDNDATDTDTSTIAITVNPITDPISDLDETVSTDEDTPVSGDLLANLTDVDSMDHTITGATVDTDGDGNPDTLVLGTATLITDNSGNAIGDITVNADGTYTFTPAPNYNGSVPVITYGIVDDNDATDTDTSTIAITVNPITDPISDLDETVSTDEESVLSGDLLANLTDADSMDHTITGASVDTDGDGNPDTLVLGTATLITDNSGNAIGDITVNADGTYTFTPAPNYNGSVPVITYGIVDDNDATDTDTSTIAITVNPITDPISDLDETVSTDEDTPVSGDLLANLTDVDSMDHTITGASVDTDGDGNPDTLVLGTATLITDNSGNAIGDITVNADGTYTFTPAPNYNGSVPVITYGIVDDNDATDTDTSTIVITVNPITDPISDLDETVSTDEDTPVSGDLLANLTDVDSMDHTITGATVDTDGDGNPDTLVLGTATLITDNSGNAIGDITVNADGTYTFTPAPNYNGSVPVITYGIVDDNDATDTDTSTIAITVNPIIDVEDDTFNTDEDTSVVVDIYNNDNDIPTDGTITITTPPTNGTVVITDPNNTPNNPSDDVVTYTPNSGYNGLDTFEYTVCDNAVPQNCDTAEVEVTVNPITDDISDDDEIISIDEESTVSGDLLANLTDADSMDHTITGATIDTDGDGNPDTLVLGIATPITDNSGNQIGDITVNTDGTYTFTPAPNYNGSVPVITYDIVDDNDATDTDTSTIAITVNPITDPIADLDETVSTDEDTPIGGDLLANLTDADSMNHTITGITVDTDGDGNPDALVLGTATPITDNSGNAIGDITVNTDGTYTFTPAPNYNGSVPTITYSIVDDNDSSDTDSSTLDIIVNAVDDNPIANNDGGTTDPGIDITIDITVNDIDPDGTIDDSTIDLDPSTMGQQITFTVPGEGIFTYNGDGTVTFSPASGYTMGTTVITYTVLDNDGNISNVATITVIVPLCTSILDTDGDGLTDCEEITGIDDPTTIEDPTTFPNGPTSDPNNPCDPGTFAGDLSNLTWANADCDGDGVTNGDEITPPSGGTPTSPNDPCNFNAADITLALSGDYLTADCDGDGVTNGDEITPPSGGTPTSPNDPCNFNAADITLALSGDYLTADCDGDGVTNGNEITPPSGGTPTSPNDPCNFNAGDITLTQSGDYLTADCDGDGVTNGDEITPPSGGTPTSPNDPCNFNAADITLALSGDYLTADCDGDGVTNGDEITPPSGGTPTNPNDPCNFNAADITLTQSGDYLTADCDGDGVTNGDEITPPSGGTPTSPNDPCNFNAADITLALSGDYLTADCDGDGVTNGDEITPPSGGTPTSPNDPCNFNAGDITLTQSGDYLTADCDGDGVTNGDEITPPSGGTPTSPNDPCNFNAADITLALSGDYLTADCDGDGVTNGDEITPPSGGTPTNPNDPCNFNAGDITLTQSGDYLTADCDGDGVTNGDEITPPSGGTPTSPNDPCNFNAGDITLTQSGDYLTADCDGDGVTNGDEITPPSGGTPTNPNDPCNFNAADITLALSGDYLTADCDGDGVTNGDEITPPSGGTPTNPNDPCNFNAADITLALSGDYLTADCDGDGVTNGDEITPPSGGTPTNPNDPCNFNAADITLALSGDYLTADCDGDGVTNGDEITPPSGGTPTSPNDPCSFNPADITLPVTTTVDCINGSIDAQNDVVTTEQDTPVDVGVYDNDNNIPTDGTIVTTNPGNGTVTIDDNGTPNNPSDDIVTYTPDVGFTGDDSFEYTVCDTAMPVADCNTALVIVTVNPRGANCRLTVINEFSPNGDGLGDETLQIECIENYPNNKLEVYNRWGNVVYKTQGYSNINGWDGTSNGRATVNASEKLPTGTYYYILDPGDGSKPIVGWLYINR